MFVKYLDKIKLVFKHFPIDSHGGSEYIARAAVAADKQGKFWPFHDFLFLNYNKLDRLEIFRLADKAGLDIVKFQKDINDPAVKDIVARDILIGEKLDVSSTPTVFINGRRLVNRSFEGFVKRIDEELAKQGK